MSRSTDPAHFFQTTNSISESQRKAEKSRNQLGDPIQLTSKILAAVSDPDHADHVLLAGSTGTVRRITLQSDGQTLGVYTGPKAPITCIAFSQHNPRLVFAGCWDKNIWSWDAETYAPHRTYVGHSDFVKALLIVNIGGRELLISGGADTAIIVWDILSGSKLHIQKSHSRGVLALAVDPHSIETEAVTATDGSRKAVSAMTVFSADSTREIRTWRLTSTFFDEVTTNTPYPITAHETSVNALWFDTDGDLWTASSDKTAKCLVRERNWTADTVLSHPDFVRDILVDETGKWVITACRDEEIRLWERGSGKLYHIFTGHFEEVTGLILLGHQLISVSIDATVRRWSLKPQDILLAKAEKENPKSEEKKATKGSVLTEEEEQELADLMEDSE